MADLFLSITDFLVDFCIYTGTSDFGALLALGLVVCCIFLTLKKLMTY